MTAPEVIFDGVTPEEAYAALIAQQQAAQKAKAAQQTKATLANLAKTAGAKYLLPAGIAGYGATELAGVGAAEAAAPAAYGSFVGPAGVEATAPVAGGSLLPAAGIAAGAYTGYKQFEGAKKLAQGKDPSLIEHAALFPLTGGLSLASKFGFGGGKSGDQKKRDNVRASLRDLQVINPDDWNINFSHGGTFNTAAGTKDEYKIDPQAGDNGRAIGQLNALAAFSSGSGEGSRAKDDAVGFLANATTKSGGDMTKNARELYERAGYNKESALAGVDSLLSSGKLDDAQAAAYRNGIIDVFGGGGGSSSSGGDGSGGSSDSSKKGGAGKGKDRERQGRLLASLFPKISVAPDYGVDLSPMVKNPYL